MQHTAAILRPALRATRSPARFIAAAGGFTAHLALFFAVVVAGSAFVALALLLLMLAAPLAAAFLLWIAWRSGQDAATFARRLRRRARARARRRARALGLRVVNGAARP